MGEEDAARRICTFPCAPPRPRADSLQKTARKELSSTQTELYDAQARMNSAEQEALSTRHAKELGEVERKLAQFRMVQEREEAALRDAWKMREKQLWERIEGVIKKEEDKVRQRLEAERVKREAEEKKRKEEEAKRKQEQEKKDAEEKRKKDEEAQKKKEEEERKRKEEEDKKKLEEEEKARKELLAAEADARAKLGYKTANQDLYAARENLLALKDNVMATVKANKEHKSIWNKLAVFLD